MAQFDTSGLDELARQLRLSEQDIQREKTALLEIIGTAYLSEAQLAYRAKARGQRGSDGIQWKKLARGTLEARARRRGPARRIVQKRKDLAAQIRGTKGKGSTRRKAELRKKRKAELEKLQAIVDREVANHEIGVDTGLQRASAAPGFTGSDGQGGNEFRISGDRVTVGYNRKYSTHFDEARPLLPATMPDAWQAEIDRQVQERLDRIIQQRLQ